MNDQKNIGARIKTIAFVPPQAFSAGETLSSEIDTLGLGYSSGQLIAFLGATTGTPTAASLVVTLQHASTTGGSYAVFTPEETNTASSIALLTTDTTAAHALNIDFSGMKRFIKVGVNPTITGGSSPKILVSASLVAGTQAIPTVVA